MNKEIMVGAGSRSYTKVLGGMAFLVVAALLLAGCSGGSGGDTGDGDPVLPPPVIPPPVLPEPDNNLLGRIFILGTQEDLVSGVLRIFANGTDSAGNALTLADFETATVSVGGTDYPADPPAVPPTSLVTVEPVADGDDVLSLGFATDYSLSISDSELTAISGVFSLILDGLSPPNLPQTYEGIAINFAVSVVLQQEWTEDHAALDAAFELDPALLDDAIFRNGTAFYDALSFALRRDLLLEDELMGPGLGLVERCRPGHLMVAFTDGTDNASLETTKADLLPIIDESSAVMIMLGSLNADKDELIELTGDRGGFAFAHDLEGIGDVVSDWASSLSDMVKFTLDSDTDFNAVGTTITITIKLAGGETLSVEVVRPVDGFCEIAP